MGRSVEIHINHIIVNNYAPNSTLVYISLTYFLNSVFGYLEGEIYVSNSKGIVSSTYCRNLEDFLTPKVP